MALPDQPTEHVEAVVRAATSARVAKQAAAENLEYANELRNAEHDDDRRLHDEAHAAARAFALLAIADEIEALRHTLAAGGFGQPAMQRPKNPERAYGEDVDDLPVFGGIV